MKHWPSAFGDIRHPIVRITGRGRSGQRSYHFMHQKSCMLFVSKSQTSGTESMYSACEWYSLQFGLKKGFLSVFSRAVKYKYLCIGAALSSIIPAYKCVPSAVVFIEMSSSI